MIIPALYDLLDMKNLTKKYEDTPNPSQPSIKKIKLLLKINMYIEVTKLNKINKNRKLYTLFAI